MASQEKETLSSRPIPHQKVVKLFGLSQTIPFRPILLHHPLEVIPPLSKLLNYKVTKYVPCPNLPNQLNILSPFQGADTRLSY
jgi:hypothetical protein